MGYLNVFCGMVADAKRFEEALRRSAEAMNVTAKRFRCWRAAAVEADLVLRRRAPSYTARYLAAVPGMVERTRR